MIYPSWIGVLNATSTSVHISPTDATSSLPRQRRNGHVSRAISRPSAEGYADPLGQAGDIHDNEHHKQGEQAPGKDEQILRLQTLVLYNKISIIKCRLMVALIAGLLGGLRAAAAGNGLSGINEATSMVYLGRWVINSVFLKSAKTRTTY